MQDREIPTWAQKFFNRQNVEQIREAIRAAEICTSGEIVVAITERVTPPTILGFSAMRWLLPTSDINHLAMLHAEVTFYRSGIHHTGGKTGILISVSLLEHQVVVLADKAISDKLPPSTWNEVVELVLKSARSKDLAAGLGSAVSLCGEILAKHFSAPERNLNELEDHLLFI